MGRASPSGCALCSRTRSPRHRSVPSHRCRLHSHIPSSVLISRLIFELVSTSFRCGDGVSNFGAVLEWCTPQPVAWEMQPLHSEPTRLHPYHDRRWFATILPYLLTTGVQNIYTHVCRILTRTFSAPMRLTQRTILDAETAEEAKSLLRYISNDSSTPDQLSDSLLRFYTRFPPLQRQMQRLSLLQQRLEGSGSEDEFAVVTVYAIASCAIARRPPVITKWPPPSSD